VREVSLVGGQPLVDGLVCWVCWSCSCYRWGLFFSFVHWSRSCCWLWGVGDEKARLANTGAMGRRRGGASLLPLLALELLLLVDVHLEYERHGGEHWRVFLKEIYDCPVRGYAQRRGRAKGRGMRRGDELRQGQIVDAFKNEKKRR
jgi:hypothetical protein